MIRVHRSECPPVLTENGATWTRELLDALAAGGAVSESIRYRYRHKEVKERLRTDTHCKCIYCEIKVSVGETDHFEPFSARPDLVCAWDNLGLACRECNTAKGAYHAPSEPLVNPYTDEPSDHLFFFGPMVLGRAGDAKGLRTVLRLALGRTDLLQRRAKRIEGIKALVEQWIAQPIGQTKELLRTALLAEAADAAEFAAIVRSYFYQELGWRYPEPTPAAQMDVLDPQEP